MLAKPILRVHIFLIEFGELIPRLRLDLTRTTRRRIRSVWFLHFLSPTDNFLQNVPNWDRHTIVGTNPELFKDYLRLTSVRSVLCTPADADGVLQDPRPEMIRPYPVLQQTLLELKKRWREKVSYAWICNQFKSLRQDLTVCCTF